MWFWIGSIITGTSLTVGVAAWVLYLVRKGGY